MSYSNLDLMEKGTRYEHYKELVEVFSDGVEILKNLHPAHRSVSDMERIEKLQHAIELINTRIEHLAGFDNQIRYGSTFDNMLWNIPKVRKGLTEGTNGTDDNQASTGADPQA